MLIRMGHRTESREFLTLRQCLPPHATVVAFNDLGAHGISPQELLAEALSAVEGVPSSNTFDHNIVIKASTLVADGSKKHIHAAVADWTGAKSITLTHKPVDSRNIFSPKKTYLLVGFTGQIGHFIDHNETFTAELMNSFRPDCFPSNVFPILRKMPKWLTPSLRLMEKLRHEYVGEMWAFRRKIEKLVQDGSATECIYKHFLTNRDQYSVTDEESVHTFQAMIDGGTRSPHNNLLTFLYLMMEFPEWQKKLQEEVDIVVGGDRMPSHTDIPNLPTVRAIVKETVRYRSIVAEMGISHCLQVDDIYKGYFFEKGTVFNAIFA